MDLGSRSKTIIWVVLIGVTLLLSNYRLTPSSFADGKGFAELESIKSVHKKEMDEIDERNYELQSLPADVYNEIQDFMKQPIQERPTPPYTPGLFLHIGKAGGSTLSSIHPNACHSFAQSKCDERREKWLNHTHNETYFGALTTYVHTPDFPMLRNDTEDYYEDYSFYVSTLRDPYTKFLSAFTHKHPANTNQTSPKCRRLHRCFWTPEHFTTALGDNPFDFEYPYPSNKLVTANCTNLARAIMANRMKVCLDHMYWNTKTILDLIPGWNTNSSRSIRTRTNNTDPILLVVRTEHMDRDFFTVNSILGDPYPVELKDADGLQYGRIQKVENIPTNLTDAGRARLCNALLPEYKAYVQALSRAINLSNRDRQLSLNLARKSCPTLDWLFREDLDFYR